MSAYHLEDDGDLLRVYRVMDGHKVCVAVEAHTWRQGSEWTGAWLDADGTANELRHLANCATACEGMDDPAKEIGRMRIADSYVSRVPFCPDHRDKMAGKPCRECLIEQQERHLREALDALEELYKVAAPNSYPLTVFNAAVKATEGAQTILRKHGRAV